MIERFENRPPSRFDDVRDYPPQSCDFPGRVNAYLDGSRRVRSDFVADSLTLSADFFRQI